MADLSSDTRPMASDRPDSMHPPDGVAETHNTHRNLHRNVQRDEHVESVLRARVAARIGLIAWPVITVIAHAGIGFQTPFLWVRMVGWFFLAILTRLFWQKPMITPRALHVVDIAAWGLFSIIFSVLCFESGGIGSSHVMEIAALVLCRSVVFSSPWKRGFVPVAFIVTAHPAVLLTASFFSPEVASQFHDSALLHALYHRLLMLSLMGVLAIVGGDSVWALRRKLYQARNIGRYRLMERLGAGGMGEVWKAFHTPLKREVALKILKLDISHQEDSIARFEREAEATAGLNHPNTIRVFDYGVTEDGLCYYAMELLRGENLSQLVCREGPLAPARALGLMLQATSGLAEAHSRGIVHRDIKPENLFLAIQSDGQEIVKVIDFGLVRITHNTDETALTQSGMAMGTPMFMSPEVIKGQTADARSDVYALGCVFYFLLCGRMPFEGTSLPPILMGHVSLHPELPSSWLGRPLPQGLETIVMRCLEKTPDDRYNTAKELREALLEHSIARTEPAFELQQGR